MADVHQLLATFSRNDAIGEHAIRIQAALSETGIGGTIHAATLNPGTRRLGLPLNGFQPAPDDLVVYHASIGSPVADVVLGLSNDIILDYLSRDKKFEEGQIRFVLLRELGDAFVSNAVTLDAIKASIIALRK